MGKSSRWIGWGVGVVLGVGLLGLAANAEPDPAKVREAMKRYEQEAEPPKPKPLPPKRRPKPRPEPAVAAPAPVERPRPAMTGPEMVEITGGCFQMGSPEQEKDRSDDEGQHRVCVEAFEIGKFEVTQGQWQAVMGSNPSSFKKCGANCPVEQVSWDDVQVYLTKLNQRTAGNYRLPTEAEWEYACRGGEAGQTYCGGNDVDRVAWYGSNSGSEPHPVGQKAANGYGLYDLSGNVWEWTCSVYDKEYGGAERKCIKKYTTAPLAVRGGGWVNFPVWVRSAFRYWNDPTYRDSFLGFRLARSL